MALTSFLRSASRDLSSAASSIRTFDLPTGREILNNQQISDLANNAINAATGFSPQSITNTFQNLQSKFDSITGPYADAISSIQTSLPGLTQAVSVLNPAVGNVVGPITQLLGAVSSGSADQSLLALFSPNSNNPVQLGQGSGGTSGVILGSPTTNAFSTSRLPNPLRNLSSHNYIISLGILTRTQTNSPNATYRSSGLSTIILSSAGGNYTKRQTTATEDIFGPHGEYFIEDLEIDSLITHNQTTGPTNSTGITFTIIEPYSMGQFLESCAAAAVTNGYRNFTSAPYVLELKFVGYDSAGNQIDSGVSPKYIPFMFTDIQFDVDGGGSKYSIEAIPYNEQSIIDQIQEVKQDSNINGETVAELLQTNPINSLSNVMNSRVATQEDTGIISQGDRYVICFPTQGKDIQEAVDDATARFQSGNLATGPAQVDTTNLAGITAASTSGGGLFESLKAWANNPANISTIGQSRLTLDVNEEGDRPSAFADLSIDIENVLRPVQRNAESAQMADVTRNFQITQGTRILETITDAIVHSEYGRQIIEGPNQQGQYQWFKVDLKTYVEIDPSTAQQTGNDPQIYVYQVKPFLADESFFQGPTRRSTATPILKSNALKTFNYLYTGLNEDVIDFNINYKMAFFEAMAADMGQLNAGNIVGAGNETVDTGPEPPTVRAPEGIGAGTSDDPNEGTPRQIDSIDHSGNSGGGFRAGRIDQNKIQVANMFSKALTESVTDLINAELEIWGDPYFIPDSGMGNFTDSAVPGAPGVTTGGTIETLNQESFILINFRLPYDYDASTGLMTFSRLQRQFSGLYEVISILNKFKNGVFTQTLSVMRRRAQSDESTGDTQTIRESGPTGRGDLLEGLDAFGGPGGPVGGRDAERTSDDAGTGTGASGQGNTGSRTTGSSPNITATGAPTGTTPPNIEYVSGFGSKTRNQAVNPQLLQVLQSAAEAASVRVVITSGGQDVYPSGRRTGSRRHDAGFAADVALYDGDRRLRVNDPEELSIVQTFIRAAKAAGATGVGAGNGYMSDQTYHIDIADGNSLQPGQSGYGARYWGTSSASSAGAPAWLRQIMSG